MGKLKYIETENLTNYLKNSNITTSKKAVKNIGIADIIILFLSIIFIENKLIYGIIVSIINILVAVSIVYYLRKVNHSDKNNFLFTGIYFCYLSLCLAVLVYSAISQVDRGRSLIMFLLLLLLDVLIAFFTIIVQRSNIFKNRYHTKISHGSAIIGSLVVAGACFGRTLDNINFLYVLSASAAVCSLCFASASHMFLRFLCCKVLEERRKVQ